MEIRMRLIQSAVDVYRQQPWDLFEENEVFEIGNLRAGCKAFCLFHKKQGKKSITVYGGIEAFSDLSDSFKRVPVEQLEKFRKFECQVFEVVFDDVENLDEESLKAGDALGLSARELPAITYRDKRCYPDLPDEMEQDYLSEILDGLKEALSAYLVNRVNLDFEKNRFVYDCKKKTYSSKRTGYRPRKYDLVEIDDPVLMEDLLMQERVEEVWEFDLQVTSLRVEKEGTQRQQPIYLAVIASVFNEQILTAIPLIVDEDFQFQCIDLMIEALNVRGIPSAFVIRHPLIASAMMDLAKKLEIQIIPTEVFEMVDDFVSGLAEYMDEGEKTC